MTTLRQSALGASLIVFLAGCQAGPTDADTPIVGSALATMGEGWTPIAPGDATTCSDASDFRFFVRAADPQQLVLYFQGGGACWTGASCDPHGDPTYKPQAEEELRSASGADVEEDAMHGMMAFHHPENPFSNHSVVFVPYCTADVHIGDGVSSYTIESTPDAPERVVEIEHRGYVNAMAVLGWTYEQFLAPESILVAGSSAGAIPSPLYARFVAEQYPDARVAVVGDGAGGYRNLLGTARPHESWGTLDALSSLPEFAAMKPEEFTFESLYITSGHRHPRIRLGRYDTAEDVVQRQFLSLGGADVERLQPLLDANDADLDAALDNYVSYVAPGELHTILLRPEFYTYQVNGVRIRDWVAALAAGEPVQDVHCGECRVDEITAP